MKKIINSLLILFTTITILAPAAPAYAVNFFDTNQKNSPCTDQTKNSPLCQPDKSTQNPVIHAIRITTNIIATISGFLAVFMIIISGFQFVTSGGSDESVANARKRIVNSVIGLIIVAMAWTIIRFVTDRVAA